MNIKFEIDFGNYEQETLNNKDLGLNFLKVKDHLLSGGKAKRKSWVYKLYVYYNFNAKCVHYTYKNLKNPEKVSSNTFSLFKELEDVLATDWELL